MANKSRKIKVDIVKKDFEKFPFNEEFKGLKIEKIRCLTPKERDDNFRGNNVPIMIELSNGGKIQAFAGAFSIPCDTVWDSQEKRYRKMTKDEMNNPHFKGRTQRKVNSIEDLEDNKGEYVY